MNDYDDFADIMNQYQEDAQLLNELLSGFAQEASAMAGTMESMSTGINDIAITVDESANAVSTVAADATELVSAMMGIQGETANNRRVSEDMIGEVRRFKKL